MAWLVGKRKEREERLFSFYADIITAPSETDAEYYAEVSRGSAKIAITQNVVDVSDYQLSQFSFQFSEPTVVLTGSFNYRHSAVVDAAKWLRNEVWPLVLQDVPQARLLLIGPGSVESHLEDPNLRINALGMVASTVPYIAQADVIVVPLRYESGTRFKILEAGILKKSVVSTTLGAEGLPVIHGEHLLIADSPVSFAAHICATLNNAPAHLGQNLCQLVEEQFLIENLEQSVQDILAECYS